MNYEAITIPNLVRQGIPKNTSGKYSSVKRNGKWIHTSVEEFFEKVEDLALGYYEMGLRKGDKVSLHSENSTEWLLCDQAALSIGIATVPIYTTQPGDQIKYILENSEAKIHIVSNDLLFEETKPLMKSITSIEAVITILGSKHKKLKTLDSIIEKGRKLKSEQPDLFNKLMSEVSPSDLATLIYTSGTTGVPKGVMLSHNNIACNALACVHELFPFKPEDFKNPEILNYLPLAHIFERTASYTFVYMGVPVNYIEDISEIKDDLATVKPVYFVTVPRLLEKIVTGIKQKGQELSGIKKRLYYWAIDLAENFDPEKKQSAFEKWKFKMADKLIYSKITPLFGGNLIGMNVGGAALSPSIARFMNGIGLFCGLGYGLTETSPVLTGPPKKKVRIGSSGKAIKDVQIRIAEDGEIQAKGPNVMEGYYKLPDQTKEAFTDDGWFCTGDIGYIDDEGWLFITDRKKSLFKLSTGKYVAPQPIENALATSGFIDQAVVIGSERKFCSALIVPDWNNLEKRFKQNGFELPKENRSEDEFVIKRIQKEVDKVNEKLPKWEQVKKFAILEQPFTIENGELTPKMSVRRSIVLKKFASEVDGIYKEEEG